MPGRRRNSPSTSSTTTTAIPQVAAKLTETTKKVSRTRTGTTMATGTMAATTTTTTSSTALNLRRSPRFIVTGHGHQQTSRALQLPTSTHMEGQGRKSLKRQCCPTTRRVLPDPVTTSSSTSSEEDDGRLACTTRRKRKENSTTLVESPTKRLRTRAAISSPSQGSSKPQAPHSSSIVTTPALPKHGRTTRSSTHGRKTSSTSGTTTTITKVPNKSSNKLVATRRSSPEPAPLATAPSSPSSPSRLLPASSPTLAPTPLPSTCKASAPSPTSSPSAFTLLASSPQRAPLEMIDLGAPLISRDESPRLAGLPGLVAPPIEGTPEVKDHEQFGLWTSPPPSPLTPLPTAPPSPTSPTCAINVLEALEPIRPRQEVSSLSASSASQSESAAQNDSMDVDTPDTPSQRSLDQIETSNAAQVQVQLQLQTNVTIPGPHHHQDEDGEDIPPLVQPHQHIPQQLQPIEDIRQDESASSTYTFPSTTDQLPQQTSVQQPQPQSFQQAQPIVLQSQSQQSQHTQHLLPVQAQPPLQAQPQAHQAQPQQQSQQQFPSYSWYDVQEFPQQQILHWEEPPRMEQVKNVWKFACKYRVWDVLCRYTPTTIRSVVAQEASDYHTTYGYPAGCFSRVRCQRNRRKLNLDLGPGGAYAGSSSSRPIRRKRRRMEIDKVDNGVPGEDTGKGKDKVDSKSRQVTPTLDGMEGVEACGSSGKEGLIKDSPTSPSPVSPDDEEREKFMDEEYYDWEIRSDDDVDEDDMEDDEVFYYEEYDEDDDCYDDEETDSEDDDYMDEEMMQGMELALEGNEKRRAGSVEKESGDLPEQEKKKTDDVGADTDLHLNVVHVDDDPSFNAELTTSLSCLGSRPDPSSNAGSASNPSEVLNACDQGTGTNPGSPTSPPSSAMSSSFLPSSSSTAVPSHCTGSSSNVKCPTARNDTLISMFYCPPPHPHQVQQMHQVQSPLQPQVQQQATLSLGIPQQQLPIQLQQTPQPLQPLQIQDSRPQEVQGEPQQLRQPVPQQPLQPHQSLQQPQQEIQLLPSPPAQSRFIPDPFPAQIRPPTPAPFSASPSFYSNEYGRQEQGHICVPVPQDQQQQPPSQPTPQAPLPHMPSFNVPNVGNVDQIPMSTPLTASPPGSTPLPGLPGTIPSPLTPISPLSAPMPAPAVLPLPPPRLASIRVRPLRYGDLGLASVLGKGTPADRDRGMQWARAGQFAFTWHAATGTQQMVDVAMNDVREGEGPNCSMEERGQSGQRRSDEMEGVEVGMEQPGRDADQQRQEQPQQQGGKGPNQEQDKMQIVNGFNETDQSLWDAFFATLQTPEHEIPEEARPQPIAGSSETAPAPGPGDSVSASSELTLDSTSAASTGITSPTSAAAVGSPTAVNVNATVFGMNFGLGLGMGFVNGSVNHISLGFGGSGVPEPPMMMNTGSPSVAATSSSSSQVPGSSSSSSSPLSNTPVSPLSNMSPLYPIHPHVGHSSSMNMSGVQTYLSGSPMSIPLSTMAMSMSMAVPMGIPGMNAVGTMGMSMQMPVPGHEQAPSPTPAGTSGVSSPASPAPGTSALSFALG